MKIRRPQFKFNLNKRLRIGPLSFTYLAILLFFGIGFVYIVTVNIVANKGSELRLMEMENKNITAENERLEVEAARLKSLSVIEDEATGEVQVGDLEPINEETKEVVLAKPEAPKMVQSQQLHYLPSYSSLAQR